MGFIFKTGTVVLLLIILIVVLPNLLNSNEKEHFSDEKRLSIAREVYHEDNLGDSVEVKAGSYYNDRSDLHLRLFGKKYRELWDTPVKVKVFKLTDSINSFVCTDIGGGDQTINIELVDAEGKTWTLRSIDKDQSKALHPWIRYTIIRPVVRDEVAAMNPYGAFVADNLAEAAGISLHTNPSLVFVPYSESMKDSCRLKMAGRMALLEEEPDDEGWSNQPQFMNAEKVVDSEQMFMELLQHPQRHIDTTGYLKARLFDILISDWDRHDGQWAWALKNNIYHPVPVDRDMSFYLFDDGLINELVLLFNNKFRSFHREYKDVDGFVYNSKMLDTRLLKPLQENDFINQAALLQEELTIHEIEKAFKDYPEAVYIKVGREHANILIQRKDKLKTAAKEFFTAVQDN